VLEAAAFRAGEEEAAALVADVGELDVVHDDEVVEVGEERGDLVAGGFEQDGIFEQEGGEVALDAALGVEDEVVAALAGGELDGVGDHAVEPADAVGAGDADPAGRVERGDGGPGEERGELRNRNPGWIADSGGLECGGHIGGRETAYTIDYSDPFQGCAEGWWVGFRAARSS
jgi:hypothetical protein